MLNIIVTSKPVDGLLYYSYEYCSYLNSIGVDSRVVIICHRDFTPEQYQTVFENKYIHFQNVVFDDFSPVEDDISMILGRSMLTLSWKNFRDYSYKQQQKLFNVFGHKLIYMY